MPGCEKLKFDSGCITAADVSAVVKGDKDFIGQLIQSKLLPENSTSSTDDDLAVVEHVSKLLSERCALLASSGVCQLEGERIELDH